MEVTDWAYDFVDLSIERRAWTKMVASPHGAAKIGYYRWLEIVMWEKPGMRSYGCSGFDAARLIRGPRMADVQYTVFYGYVRTNSLYCRGLHLNLFIFDHDANTLIILSPWQTTVESERSASLSYYAMELVFALRRARMLASVIKVPGPLKAWDMPMSCITEITRQLLTEEILLDHIDGWDITCDFDFVEPPDGLGTRTPSPALLEDLVLDGDHRDEQQSSASEDDEDPTSQEFETSAGEDDDEHDDTAQTKRNEPDDSCPPTDEPPAKDAKKN